MKRLALPLLIGLLALSGCASQYVIRLTNGAEISTPGKPRLKGNVYYFKDANGGEHSVAQGRVREIEPASMAREEEKANQPKAPKAKRKHKWYFLWLF